ncbi:uncharacterized protein LAESUDRAFT_503490 [Laetiporus sulphureus 93-53]|uniref:Uncharacterized protein n=1 Tax=Laetiporus sulphureus 93-53 TaxID=1314785 RepID=A0A165BFL5_9APHY|nr:uncharacterized protein LAESUDRAFT_503490 [Laetiporus sulphureus 93-53]KZT00952.1 hypothetical protein LAESUDRAFT_503490 [Laetiporus sulphureus 93-53]
MMTISITGNIDRVHYESRLSACAPFVIISGPPLENTSSYGGLAHRLLVHARFQIYDKRKMIESISLVILDGAKGGIRITGVRLKFCATMVPSWCDRYSTASTTLMWETIRASKRHLELRQWQQPSSPTTFSTLNLYLMSFMIHAQWAWVSCCC